MLLSWKLWRTLYLPPSTHILYRRTVAAAPLASLRPLLERVDSRWWWVLTALVLGYLLLHGGIMNLLMVFFVLPGVIILAFVALPLLLPVITTFVGGYWAASTSHSVLRERDARTYDLLCLGPNGTLGANWAIASDRLHQTGLFSSLYLGNIASMILCALAVALMLGIVGLMTLAGSSVDQLIPAARTLFDLVVLLSALWLHYIQSVVLSVLVGLYVPTLMGHDASWVAFGFYQVVQMATYSLFALVFHLLAPLTATIAPESWLAFLGVPFFFLMVLMLLRESVVIWLWSTLSLRLNADVIERNIFLR